MPMDSVTGSSSVIGETDVAHHKTLGDDGDLAIWPLSGARCGCCSSYSRLYLVLPTAAHRNGRQEEAWEHYTRALSRDPTHVGLLLNRSLTAWKQGQRLFQTPASPALTTES